MSVIHKEDSIQEVIAAKKAEQDRLLNEKERDAVLLELDYKLMMLEKGMGGGI